MKKLTKQQVDKLNGYARGEAYDILSNGEKGYCRETGTLVICCANCGDYVHVHVGPLKGVKYD